MDAPANTEIFMIAGYTVFFAGLVVYLVSLVVRYRNLKKEEEMLEEVGEEVVIR